MTYHAEPGSHSYERLRLLGHLAARRDAERLSPATAPAVAGKHSTPWDVSSK
ncbi:hypothetical protein [Streptomyces camponoticapitis]|uniref:hypothetical protein n=1 Tax=Streptomyces camponoticapitis TaxID=1616125 RepID=UPI0016653465|nr:hypothetical protein [Streptomyces camponoticapitis]